MRHTLSAFNLFDLVMLSAIAATALGTVFAATATVLGAV
jgi:hypothetical protein